MPNYLRKWNDRTILVRPTKWDGKEEVPPWDCLDITEIVERKTEKSQRVREHIVIDLRNIEYAISWECEKNPHLYRSPSFTKLYADNPRMKHPHFGCCVVAAEAMFFLTPEHKNPQLYRAMDNEGIYHWWLEIEVGDEVGLPIESDRLEKLDPTHQQFSKLPFDPPYDDGKKTSLMGWKQSPSKRTLDLISNCNYLSLITTRYRTNDSNFRPPETPGTLETFFD